MSIAHQTMLPSVIAYLWNITFKSASKESHIAFAIKKQLFLCYYSYDTLNINISMPKQKEVLVFRFESHWFWPPGLILKGFEQLYCPAAMNNSLLEYFL